MISEAVVEKKVEPAAVRIEVRAQGESYIHARTGKKVTIVMPAYNAAETLAATYADIPAGSYDEVILVDDASQDDTVKLSERLNLVTVAHPENRGYGANQKTCYKTALARGADIVIMLHPDYQYDPRMVPNLALPIAEGQADAVLASRFLHDPIEGGPLRGGMPIWKYISNRFLTKVENLALRTHFSEFHTGYRAYSRKALESIPFERNSDDFVFDNEIIVQMVKKGISFKEVPVIARYFPEASSIGLRTSIRYGLAVLGVVRKTLRHFSGRESCPLFLDEAVETPAPATCSLCGGEAKPVYPGSPTVTACVDCGVASLDKFPDDADRSAGYQDDYYREGTGNRFPKPIEAIVRFFRRRRLNAITKHEPGPASILDVGCGRGVLLELFKKRGWRVLGTQLSETAAQAARERRDIDVHVGELTEIPDPGTRFKVVSMFHVLEHVTDPRAYLSRIHDLMEEKGLLVVEVPDFGGPGFRVLGQRNLCFDWPNHLVMFTRKSLQRLLKNSGFRVEAVSRFSLEYSPFTTLQNMLNVLPGTPNRFYRSLASNPEGRRLRKSPVTWLHGLLAIALAPVAFAISLTSLVLPWGNTIRFIARRE